jgi:hypothetical protein
MKPSGASPGGVRGAIHFLDRTDFGQWVMPLAGPHEV